MDINTAWKKTSKLLLGEEIGELSDYEGYLKKYCEPVGEKKSALSGKRVHVSEQDHCRGARFIGFEEVEEYQKMIGGKPIEDAQLASLDSILEAVLPKALYTGNVILGNSGDCIDCDRCSNTRFALQSHDLSDSKFCAYSYLSRVCGFSFGSGFMGECDQVMQVHYGYRTIRSFECLRMFNCADCYFSAGLENCQNCIFCFNLKNRSYCVGNLQVSKEEYGKFRQKMLGEVRNELKAKKDVFGIVGLIAHGNFKGTESELRVQRGIEKSPYFGTGKPVPKVLEEGFRNTSKLLLGTGLSGIEQYEKWLMRHVRVPPKMKSAASGKPMYNVPVLAFAYTTKNCVTIEEAEKMAKGSITQEELEKLSVHTAKDLLGRIKYFTPETKFGDSLDVEESVDFSSSMHCWRGACYWTSRYCCYTFWMRDGEHMYGSDLVFYSKFCLKCYNSQHLTRCFEVSESLSCSDCYFCHNCENLQDCMFCFNAKAKRYAIGNVEMPREKYLGIKKKILAEIASRLQAEHDLELSIYNVGCKGKA